MANKYLDSDGLLYFWTKIKDKLSTKVDKETGKGLSTNDYTSAEKEKLSGIDTGANKYTLPTATDTVKGGVIVGDNISVNSGKISVGTASKAAKGVVKIGANIDVTEGEISVADATTAKKGVVSVGDNIDVADAEISVADATTAKKGVVSVGNNINVANAQISVADASTTAKGVMQVGDYLSASNGKVSVKTGSTSQAGVVKLQDSIDTTATTAVTPNAVKNALDKKVDAQTGKGLSSNDYTDTEKNKLGKIEENANNYSLPTATSSTLGGVKIGSNITIASGAIKVADGSTSAKGVVKLQDSIDTTATTAVTPNAVKTALDNVYTKSEIDGMMYSAINYKGTVKTYAELPTSGNVAGDVWNVATADSEHGIAAGDNVAWNGTSWDVLSAAINLSDYLQISSVIANTDIDTIVAK